MHPRIEGLWAKCWPASNPQELGTNTSLNPFQWSARWTAPPSPRRCTWGRRRTRGKLYRWGWGLTRRQSRGSPVTNSGSEPLGVLWDPLKAPSDSLGTPGAPKARGLRLWPVWRFIFGCSWGPPTWGWIDTRLRDWTVNIRKGSKENLRGSLAGGGIVVNEWRIEDDDERSEHHGDHFPRCQEHVVLRHLIGCVLTLNDWILITWINK